MNHSGSHELSSEWTENDDFSLIHESLIYMEGFLKHEHWPSVSYLSPNNTAKFIPSFASVVGPAIHVLSSASHRNSFYRVLSLGTVRSPHTRLDQSTVYPLKRIKASKGRYLRSIYERIPSPAYDTSLGWLDRRCRTLVCRGRRYRGLNN